MELTSWIMYRYFRQVHDYQWQGGAKNFSGFETNDWKHFFVDYFGKKGFGRKFLEFCVENNRLFWVQLQPDRTFLGINNLANFAFPCHHYSWVPSPPPFLCGCHFFYLNLFKQIFIQGVSMTLILIIKIVYICITQYITTN